MSAEAGDAAVRVLQHDEVEPRPGCRPFGLGDHAQCRHRLERGRGAAAAGVADDQGLSAGEAEDAGGVGAGVSAADDHRLERGHHRCARDEAVLREVSVAGRERGDGVVHEDGLHLIMWTPSTIPSFVDTVH